MLEPDATSGKPQSTSVFALDTTTGSIVHQFFAYLTRVGVGRVSALFAFYVVAVALTLLPLLLGASIDPANSDYSLIFPSQKLRVPVLYDWDILFAFLVSFPCLIILIATDQQVLATSLDTVQFEGTITISETDKHELVTRWKRRFEVYNIVGQICGVIVGAGVVAFNYWVYKSNNHSLSYWIVGDQELRAVGYVFLYCIFLFFALIPIYVLRNIGISLLLDDIMARARLRFLPLHPDRCWGLRAVGRLGLRNQYALTLFGVNVVLLGWVIYLIQLKQQAASPYYLVVAAACAYVVLGPIVFLGPLLPFRSSMQANKREVMSDLIQRLRVEFDSLRVRFPSGQFTEESEELIERLRKLSAAVDALPVWPFDPSTLRKFLTAYVIPIAGAIFSVVQIVLAVFKH